MDEIDKRRTTFVASGFLLLTRWSLLRPWSQVVVGRRDKWLDE